MNWKKYWLSAVAILIVAKGIISALFFAVIFDFVYSRQSVGLRPEGQEFHAAGMICVIVWSLGFTYLYARGSQNNGLKHGLKFGITAWVFYFIPMLTGVWGYFQVSFMWVLAGLISGLAEALTAGLLVGIIYRKKTV